MSPKSLQPTEAVREAIMEAIAAEEAIRDEMRRGGVRRSPMFEFAQYLRGCPEFQGLDAYAALTLVRKSLEADGESLPELLDEYDDPEASLLKMWNIVVFPETFEAAVRLAQQRPIEEEKFVSKGYSAFRSLCAHLQELSGDAPIIVPCERFAAALNVSPRTISTYRDVGVKMGLLKLVTGADYFAHKAARFRVLGTFKYR